MADECRHKKNWLNVVLGPVRRYHFPDTSLWYWCRCEGCGHLGLFSQVTLASRWVRRQ